jgi:hypothetical protein
MHGAAPVPQLWAHCNSNEKQQMTPEPRRALLVRGRDTGHISSGRFLQPGAERSIRFPVKQFLNSGVIGTPSVYALGRAS